MKIVNSMKEPYTFTFDGGNYTILSGQIVDLPDELANHAIKRSVVHDDIGDVMGYRVKALQSMSREEVRAIATYPCPMVLSGDCDAPDFKSLDDLRRHMETHWGGATDNAKASAAPLKR